MIINCDTDRFVKEVINKNEYSFAFKDMIVIDIGCSIGTFSLYVRKLCRKIYAIDISQGCVDMFNETIRLNNLKNIETFCCGITRGSGEMTIDTGGQIPGGGSWKLRQMGPDNPRVKTYSLGEFMRNNSIQRADMVKMDVEGMEVDILAASDFPKDKIRSIFGEVHISNTGELLPIRPRLEEMGFEYFDYGEHFMARKL